jgi:hypothetical protein
VTGLRFLGGCLVATIAGAVALVLAGLLLGWSRLDL